MKAKLRFFPIAAVLLVLVLSAALYPQTANTLKALGQAGKVVLSPRLLLSLLQQEGTPLAGEQVLPRPVQIMLSLLRSNRIDTFRYSRSIAANEEIRQRLLESALPARYEPKSPYLIAIAGEQTSPACKPLASQEGVVLVQCP